MDLPQIGAHCSWKSCNALDFLPISCQCDKMFCSEHISPDHHNCPLSKTEYTKSTFNDKIRRCEVKDCHKPSLTNDEETCSHCHKLLCSEHRFKDLHDCPSLVLEVANDNTVKAAPSLTQRSASIIPSRKPPKDPVKLAQWRKVELMKMRHRAIPADAKDRNAPVPVDQRIHVRVTNDDMEKVFWLRKTVITGKAIDLFVDNLKLVFPENTPLQLCAAPFIGGEFTILRNDKPLSEQVDDGFTLTVQRKDP